MYISLIDTSPTERIASPALQPIQSVTGQRNSRVVEVWWAKRRPAAQELVFSRCLSASIFFIISSPALIPLKDNGAFGDWNTAHPHPHPLGKWDFWRCLQFWHCSICLFLFSYLRTSSGLAEHFFVSVFRKTGRPWKMQRSLL